MHLSLTTGVHMSVNTYKNHSHGNSPGTSLPVMHLVGTRMETGMETVQCQWNDIFHACKNIRSRTNYGTTLNENGYSTHLLTDLFILITELAGNEQVKRKKNWQ